MSRAKILIVEDEGIEALDLQHRLISLGYAVLDAVSTGEEAVHMTEETCPDLVLMDIMLSGEIDGVAAAAQIQNRFDIPIIYITAYADEATLQRAKITEPYGYIVKPFRERELHITIDMALYKHKMERRLKESEKWLATTLRSIGDAVIATDRNGLITFMNPVAEDLMGWKLEEVLKRNLTEVFKIVNRNTRKPVENPVERVLLEGLTIGLANHTDLIARNGKEVPIDDSAAPIKDDKGNIIGVILVFRDVTEREKALDEICRYRDELELRVMERTTELAKANEELEARASRLERLNKELMDFAFAASHDLSEPLRKIQTYGSLLKTKCADRLNVHDRDYVSRMTGSANRMQELLDALLRYSRIETKGQDFRPTNLDDIVKNAAGDLEVAIQKAGAHLEIGPLPIVHGDPCQLRQLFQNLIANSVKYHRSEVRTIIKIYGEEIGGATRIFVEDNGIGFDEKYLDKIFQPFQRLHGKTEYSGTGIGLAICRKIVERHGGTITGKSTPREGATFVVTLPAKKGAA